MTIDKEQIQGQYSRMPMEYLNNKDLGLEERGLLMSLYSLPENWNFSIEGLASIMPDGVSKVRTTFNRLVKKGYICVNRVRGPDGRYKRGTMQLFIHPQRAEDLPAENPHVEKLHVEKPHVEKPPAEAPHAMEQTESNIKKSNMKDSKNKKYSMKESTPLPQKSGSVNGSPYKRKNAFNNFEQRTYDFETLEKMLLAAQGVQEPADTAKSG